MSTLLLPMLRLDTFTAIELEGVANRRGFRTHRTLEDSWVRLRSATAPGVLWLAGAGPRGPFVAATDHPGVAAEIPTPLVGPYPGKAAWSASDVGSLDALVDRIYRLSVSLPAHPLATYERELAKAPQDATETTEMRKRRIGQNVFRKALIDYWSGTCPLTGITEPALLRASHIRPWAECGDAERLDVHNGLLLSCLWDAAFDGGLISFENSGRLLTSQRLGPSERKALKIAPVRNIKIILKPEHLHYMRQHRVMHKF